MEHEAEAAASSKPTLSGSGPSSSFRLRSQSLNSVRLRRIFDVFDKNGDGMISIEELGKALDQLGLDADPSELESTVVCYIKAENTGLEFDDFVALHESLGKTYFGSDDLEGDDDEDGGDDDDDDDEESDMAEAFKVFDEDGDGFISAKELQVVLEKLGLPEGKEMHRVYQMITSVDRNHDGRVDFDEFKDMMKSVADRIAS